MSRELCIMACVFCRDPQFQSWASNEASKIGMVVETCRLPSRNEVYSKAFILHVCGVTSRNELDSNPAAAQRFHDLVRKPFLEWKEHR